MDNPTQPSNQPSIEALTAELNGLKRYLDYLEQKELRGTIALEAFQRVSMSIAHSLDLNKVLNTILEGSLALMDGSRDAHIFLYQDGRLRFGAARDQHGPSTQAIWEPRPDGLTYAVAKRGETIAVPDISNHELFKTADPTWEGSIIGQPLKIGDRVVGVMNLGYSKPREFPASDLHLLRLLGDQAAIAIENARLYGEAEQRARMLDAIRRANMSITASLDIQTVLETILEGTMTLLRWPTEAHIFLYDDQKLKFAAGRGRDGLLSRPYAEPREDGLTYRVAKEAMTIVVPNIRTHPLFANAPPSWNGALIGLPLKVGDRVVGVMNVGSIEPEDFSDNDLYTLNLLGDQAAVAIENARLYDKTLKDAEELEARVAERTAELNAYNHTVAHDLRGPLLMIMGYAELLETEYKAILPPKGIKQVERINTSARRMSDMIGQLLRLAELRDAATSAEPVEATPRVEAAIARFQNRISEKGVVVEIAPDLPPAMGHGIWIEEVFANLIGNAIQYMGKANVTPHLSIRGRGEGEMVRYEIQDNGLGIPPDKQEMIFKMFSRLHTGEQKGFGLGLSIVHRIVTNLRGQVGVESDGKSGSTFWFTLPAVPGSSQQSAASGQETANT